MSAQDSADDGLSFIFEVPDDDLPDPTADALDAELRHLEEQAERERRRLAASEDDAEPEVDVETVVLPADFDTWTIDRREWWGFETELPRAERADRRRLYGAWLTEHPEADPVKHKTVATAAWPSTGLTAADEEAFWTARPWLTGLRDFSRDELASPWAVFGAILALASANVAPNVVLPPRRGNGRPGAVGSLNIFSVLAGPPGSNKSVAVSVAEAFLDAIGGVTIRKAGPGSGEGIVAAFGVEDARVLPGGFRYRAVSLLLHADEVTALDALMRRTSSTLLPFLRTAWSGGDLSTLNAEATRQRFVPGHAYRLAMTVGVQPGNAGVLLADADGGLPQRMLWFSAVDPEVGTLPDSGTGPWSWTVPTPPPILIPDPAPQAGAPVALLQVLGPRRQIAMPPEAFEAYHAAAVSASRGDGDALDGHAAQARGRVTALLALLDGRTAATTDDWDLAGLVMAHSGATRAAMVAAVAAEAARTNEARGRTEGVRAAVADMARDDTLQRRAGAWAIERLRKATADGADGMTGADLRRKCSHGLRPGLTEALEALEAAGQISSETITYNGQTGFRYRVGWGS